MLGTSTDYGHENVAEIGFKTIHESQPVFREFRLAKGLLGDEMFHRARVIERTVLPLAGVA